MVEPPVADDEDDLDDPDDAVQIVLQPEGDVYEEEEEEEEAPLEGEDAAAAAPPPDGSVDAADAEAKMIQMLNGVGQALPPASEDLCLAVGGLDEP